MAHKASDLLVYLSETYKGDWKKIYNIVIKREYPDWQEMEWTVGSVTENTITILDEGYSDVLKKSYHPPFVLYYRGDISLLSDPKCFRLAVVCAGTCPASLLNKTINDLCDLSNNTVVVTSDGYIADKCSRGKGKKKCIWVKGCGLNTRVGAELVEAEIAIINNGGLIITPYPNGVTIGVLQAMERDYIIGGLCDALLVSYAEKGTNISSSIISALNGGKDIMVYPTYPSKDLTINNTLIKEGAILVEDTSDIEENIK